MSFNSIRAGSGLKVLPSAYAYLGLFNEALAQRTAMEDAVRAAEQAAMSALMTQPRLFAYAEGKARYDFPVCLTQVETKKRRIVWVVGYGRAK